MSLKCIAFDCFGTVFNTAPLLRSKVADYVKHVRKADFSPYEFPPVWYQLKAHPDSAEGLKKLMDAGFECVAMSNGSLDLIEAISEANGIKWSKIINLVKHRIYKPNVDAYRVIEKETGYKPSQCLMVTANEKFGDLEGATAIGMPSRLIRHGAPQTILELADFLGV